ncbi:Gfo/Idh/MocA family protein [Chloroflexota bacterium]
MKDKNIAVVGCGYWGKNLVRNFAKIGVLHTICDSDSARLQDLGLLYPNVNKVKDYKDVLINDEIRGIVLATPVVSHFSMAKEALLADKDVFVEKPLALNVIDGRELVELAQQKNSILMVGHILEYHPAVIKLKDLVDKEELGRIQYIYSNRLNLGKFRTDENILWSFAPHDISVILLLLGGEMPYEVSAHGGYYLSQNVADVTMTTMSFKGGVRAHVFVSWLHPFKDQRLVVVGDKKMVEFNDTNPKDKLMLYNHEIEWIEGNPVPHRKEADIVEAPLEEPLKIECQDFLNCIESRMKPAVDGRKGLQVLEILSYCQESLKENGKVITLRIE